MDKNTTQGGSGPVGGPVGTRVGGTVVGFSQSLASQDIGHLAGELLKRERQVDWVVTLLAGHLVASRASQQDVDDNEHHLDHDHDGEEQNDYFPQSKTNTTGKDTIPIDELENVMNIPTAKINYWKDNSATSSMIKLPLDVKRLLREYISIVSQCLSPAFHQCLTCMHTCTMLGLYTSLHTQLPS